MSESFPSYRGEFVLAQIFPLGLHSLSSDDSLARTAHTSHFAEWWYMVLYRSLFFFLPFSLSFSPRARFIGCFLHGHPVVRTSPAFFSLKSPLVIRSHTQRKEMAPLGNSAVSIENTSHYKSNRLHGFYYLLSKIALHSNGLLSQTAVRVWSLITEIFNIKN